MWHSINITSLLWDWVFNIISLLREVVTVWVSLHRYSMPALTQTNVFTSDAQTLTVTVGVPREPSTPQPSHVVSRTKSLRRRGFSEKVAARIPAHVHCLHGKGSDSADCTGEGSTGEWHTGLRSFSTLLRAFLFIRSSRPATVGPTIPLPALSGGACLANWR